MGRYVDHKTNAKGSLKQIRRLINDRPEIINHLLANKIGAEEFFSIDWVSPLKNDDYAEYRDQDFLNELSLSQLAVPLSAFWPTNGPQWDALGRTENAIFIVEAKANLPEIISPPCAASSPSSIDLINKSLNETKTYLGINSSYDWSSNYYQYTNRLAHLYYLRVLNKIPTYLIFVYFIGDDSVNGPKRIVDWKNKIKILETTIGSSNNHKLSEYIIDLFINVPKFKVEK
jgi:hypothetical protein